MEKDELGECHALAVSVCEAVLECGEDGDEVDARHDLSFSQDNSAEQNNDRLQLLF